MERIPSLYVADPRSVNATGSVWHPPATGSTRHPPPPPEHNRGRRSRHAASALPTTGVSPIHPPLRNATGASPSSTPPAASAAASRAQPRTTISTRRLRPPHHRRVADPSAVVQRHGFSTARNRPQIAPRDGPAQPTGRILGRCASLVMASGPSPTSAQAGRRAEGSPTRSPQEHFVTFEEGCTRMPRPVRRFSRRRFTAAARLASLRRDTWGSGPSPRRTKRTSGSDVEGIPIATTTAAAARTGTTALRTARSGFRRSPAFCVRSCCAVAWRNSS